MEIRSIGPEDGAWVLGCLVEHFASPRIVSRGVLHQADTLPGLVAVAGADPAGCDLPRVAAKAVVAADDVLHGKPQRPARRRRRHADRLEVFEQGRPAVPGRARAPVHDVVAVQGADGNRLHVRVSGQRGKTPDDRDDIIAAVRHRIEELLAQGPAV